MITGCIRWEYAKYCIFLFIKRQIDFIYEKFFNNENYCVVIMNNKSNILILIMLSVLLLFCISSVVAIDNNATTNVSVSSELDTTVSVDYIDETIKMKC